MRPFKNSMITAGVLLCGLGLPNASFGIQGCGNNYISGVYGAQVSSINLLNATRLGTTVATTGTTRHNRQHGHFRYREHYDRSWIRKHAGEPERRSSRRGALYIRWQRKHHRTAPTDDRE